MKPTLTDYLDGLEQIWQWRQSLIDDNSVEIHEIKLSSQWLDYLANIGEFIEQEVFLGKESPLSEVERERISFWTSMISNQEYDFIRITVETMERNDPTNPGLDAARDVILNFKEKYSV